MSRRRSNALFVLVMVALGLLNVFLFLFLRPHHQHPRSAAPTTPNRGSVQGLPSRAHRPAQKRKPKVRPSVHLAVAAARGSSWLVIRRGSSAGPVLYSGILPRGDMLELRGVRFYARFGALANLDVRLGGRTIDLGCARGGVTLTRRGVVPAPAACGRIVGS